MTPEWYEWCDMYDDEDYVGSDEEPELDPLADALAALRDREDEPE